MLISPSQVAQELHYVQVAVAVTPKVPGGQEVAHV